MLPSIIFVPVVQKEETAVKLSQSPKQMFCMSLCVVLAMHHFQTSRPGLPASCAHAKCFQIACNKQKLNSGYNHLSHWILLLECISIWTWGGASLLRKSSGPESVEGRGDAGVVCCKTPDCKNLNQIISP